MTSRGNLFALERVWAWRVTSTGIATGQLDPDNPGSAPLTSYPFQIRGPIAFTPPEPTFGRFTFKGGGSFEGAADAGLDDIGEGELQVSQMDMDLAAFMQGGLVDTTSIVNHKIASPNSLIPSPRQLGLMLVGRIQSRALADQGINKYFHVIYPLVQARLRTPPMTQEAGRNPSPARITFQPSVAGKFPTGVAFGANQGWYQDSEYHYWQTNAKQLMMASWLQDASATTFIMPYRPTSSVVTNGNVDNWVVRNGTPIAPTSISTTTGVVTMPSAGTANQWTVVIAPTDLVAI